MVVGRGRGGERDRDRERDRGERGGEGGVAPGAVGVIIKSLRIVEGGGLIIEFDIVGVSSTILRRRRCEVSLMKLLKEDILFPARGSGSVVCGLDQMGTESLH